MVPNVFDSPVSANTIVCSGSLFRGNRAMLEMFTALVLPKSVSGVYCGPAGSVVRKLGVFQTPAPAGAKYAGLPVGSEGPMATVEMGGGLAVWFVGPGPTGVQVSSAWTSVGACETRR